MGAEYIFACARVRGAEQNPLGKAKLGVMVEAETEEICEKYVDKIIDILVQRGHVVDR